LPVIVGRNNENVKLPSVMVGERTVYLEEFNERSAPQSAMFKVAGI
jgi:hypothetical protein